MNTVGDTTSNLNFVCHDAGWMSPVYISRALVALGTVAAQAPTVLAMGAWLNASSKMTSSVCPCTPCAFTCFHIHEHQL